MNKLKTLKETLSAINGMGNVTLPTMDGGIGSGDLDSFSNTLFKQKSSKIFLKKAKKSKTSQKSSI